ncbi:MAG: YnbE family lipoprotein [Nitrosomonas sp.]
MPEENPVAVPKIDTVKMTNFVKPVFGLMSILLIFGYGILSGCTPTVKVDPPSEPITINLNIKLDADIRVKLEEDAKKDIATNPGIF